MKRILSLLLCVAVSFTINAEVVINGIAYNLDSDAKTAEVVTTGNYYGDIVIPEKVEYDNTTYSVTSIGENAFSWCEQVTNIFLPNSLKKIGHGAFSNCKGLSSIIIPESVTSIGTSAFYGCHGLKSVKLPNNLTIIDKQVFCECYNLSYIVIPANLTYIGMNAFDGCKSLQSIVIPRSVETIDDNAFSGCSGLESMVVESGNPHYDSRDNCNAIIETESNTLVFGCKNSVIPPNVSIIARRAFSNCSSLSAISIPSGVRAISDYAFSGCSELVSITACNALSIRENVFDHETYEKATLYVPTGKGAVFQGNLIWGKFSKIVEIDMPGVDINDNPFDNLYDKRLVLSHTSREDSGGSWGGTPDDDIVLAEMFLPERMMRLKGCQITHVRFCLWHTDFNNMKVWIGTAKDKRDLALQDLNDLHEGWNVVKLEHPYTITGDTIFVGFDCHDNQMTYPVMWDAYEKTGGTCVCFREGKWNTSEGTWYIQCMVEGDNVPKYDLHIIEFAGLTQKRVIRAGDTYDCQLFVKNWGSMPIEQHEWKPMIDGEETDYEYRYGVEKIAVGGGTQEILMGIKTSKDLSVGCKKLTIVPKTLNGEKYDSPEKPKELNMRIFEHDLGRQKVLVQVYTGTWCGYCPEFDEVVEKKMQERGDLVWLSIHCGDEYSTDADKSYMSLLYSIGIPNVDLDRCVRFTPYNQREHVMKYFLDDAKGLPSFANINIAASYEGWSRRVDITISGERNEDFIPVEGWTNMTVLLVEDRVEGGQMGTDIYPYYHNGVIRANLSAIWGDLVQWNGDHYEMHYTAELDKAWNKDNMRVVAFFSKPFTGDNYDVINVMNCEEMGLKDAETGIQSLSSDEKNSDVFDLNGRKIRSGSSSISGLPKGIYIVNGRKVVIK